MPNNKSVVCQENVQKCHLNLADKESTENLPSVFPFINTMYLFSQNDSFGNVFFFSLQIYLSFFVVHKNSIKAVMQLIGCIHFKFCFCKLGIFILTLEEIKKLK